MAKNLKSVDMKKPLSAKEAIDFLNDLCDDDDLAAAFYIQPPEIETGQLSGEDDADDEEYGDIDDICPAQLKSACELVMSDGRRITTYSDNNNYTDDNTNEDEIAIDESLLANVLENSCTNLDIDLLQQSCIHPVEKSLSKITPTISSVPLPSSNKTSKFSWVKDKAEGFTSIFPFTDFQDCKNMKPHEQFEKFFDDILLQHIIDESGKYAIFLGKPNPDITKAELKTFIGILLISGYNIHSSYRTFWDNKTDMRNEMVYSSMRRNRFQQILQFLHFEDSGKEITNGDKMWKLRPLTDHVKANMIKHFHPEQNLSFDESMIAYFGRHGCKQFIKGKPLRFGYKVWSLCTPSGYLINFEIYQGKNPRSNSLYEERFGKCAAPLVNMIDDFPQDIQSLPFSFYFDNLFTSFPLLAYMKARGYNATGTIRENRIPKSCPLPHKNKLKKKKRGHIESIKMQGTDIVLTKWNDNAVVDIASTCHGVNPIKKVQRYSQQEKKRINVDRPAIVGEYNKYMCGVDRMDQNISLYRIGIKGKKWWSSIFTWLVDVSVQNAWQLHRKIMPELKQLDFRREIATYYCNHYGEKPKSAGPRKRKLQDTVEESLRFDRMDHLVRPCQKRRRCAGDECKSVGRTECAKCNVGLCIKCFISYHKKND